MVAYKPVRSNNEYLGPFRHFIIKLHLIVVPNYCFGFAFKIIGAVMGLSQVKQSTHKPTSLPAVICNCLGIKWILEKLFFNHADTCGHNKTRA